MSSWGHEIDDSRPGDLVFCIICCCPDRSCCVIDNSQPCCRKGASCHLLASAVPYDYKACNVPSDP